MLYHPTLKITCFVFLALSLSFVTQAQDVPHQSDNEATIHALLGRMSLEEKIDLLSGTHFFDVRGLPRLGLPELHTADGPFGVRNDGPATVMAGGIGLAATWNEELAAQVGAQIGRDARAKGKHFLLGPGVNIYRTPLNGRSFEYMGEDPFLASRMAVSYIRGMQSQGVCATIKHFLGNNSEFGRHTTDSIIGERALREIYLPAFEMAVKEGRVCSVMDSYNLTNGAHMTQNGTFNNDLLKKEWQFPGLVISDWDATYDTLGAANGGLDLEMPSGKFLNRDALLPLIKAGKVSQATIDDKVRRLLREELRFGWNEHPAIDIAIPRYNQQGRDVALQAAREGMVLLKNEGDLLPLDRKKIKTIAVIGPNAYPAVPVGGGSAQASPFHAISFLEGVTNYVRSDGTVYSNRGIPSLVRIAHDTNFSVSPNGSAGLKAEFYNNEKLEGSPVTTQTDKHLDFGEPLSIPAISGEDFDPSSLPSSSPKSIRWTGFYTASAPGKHDIVVQQAGFAEGGYRLYLDDKLIHDSWTLTKAIVEDTVVSLDASPHKVVLEYHSAGGFGGGFVRMGIVRQSTWVDPNAEEMAQKADVVVLAVGYEPSTESEGYDRTFQLPPGQDELVSKITSVNKNTVVVMTSGGGVDMSAWLDRVPALVQAWYPGQEGGRALAEILFGDVNPSGRLPVTFERRWEDNPSHDHYYPTAGTNRIEYQEGVFVGYRGYEKNNVKPLFPFGYGLSYTTFKFGDLRVSFSTASTAQIPSGTVSFSISNTGSRSGAVVAQLYVANPHASVVRPPKELKGFVKVNLSPGETKGVQVPLNARAFTFYDEKAEQWRAEAGTYGVLVGSSSERIELSGELKIDKTMIAP
jgi:beta-glucosidase